MRADQKAAGDKAAAAGLSRKKPDRGMAKDCLAYLTTGDWPDAWGEPEKLFAPPELSPGSFGQGFIGMADQSARNCLPEPLPEVVFQFSTFTNKTRARAYPRSLNRDGFITLLTKRDVRHEKDGKAFAPATFKATRSNADFISATGLCLDFDHGQALVEDVLAILPGTLAAFYSTHSHLPESPRFRVVIPLARPVDPDEHARLVGGFKSIIPTRLAECLDNTCFERTRSFYLPSCPPENVSHAFTGHQGGAPLDVEHFIELGVAVVPREPVRQDKPSPATPSASPRTFEFADPATGEVHDLTAWATENPTFDLVGALDPQYHRGKPKDGKHHIVCPFEDQHTDQAEDLATFAANASPPQFAAWDVHCCHAHCVDRDRLEFLQAFLENGWISADHLQAAAAAPAVLELRRPSFVNYCVQEIATELSLKPLQHDEFRIFLHLMHIAWVAHDGALLDDDWSIHRGLGITADQWATYRTTLVRSGWLVEDGGRLLNPVTKREYDKSQSALMGKIAGGRKGGLKTHRKEG